MGRAPLHALVWSREQHLYELYTQGQLEQRFQPADEAAWQVWLRKVASFAFHGRGGSLNVHLERRPRAGAFARRSGECTLYSTDAALRSGRLGEDDAALHLGQQTSLPGRLALAG